MKKSRAPCIRISCGLLALMLTLSPLATLASYATEVEFEENETNVENSDSDKDKDHEVTAGAEADAEAESGTTTNVTTVEDKIYISVETQAQSHAEAYASSVEQLEDYESIVYSANNNIDSCFWKPKLEDVPNLEAWVMKNGAYNSAYTGFFDLDNKQPNKLMDFVSRECEVMGYDAIVSSEYVDSAGNYHAVLMNTDYITRHEALMLLYKALGQYEYEYAITDKHDKDVMVFISRSNMSKYTERASQDGLINPYDNNGATMSGADFVMTAVHLMQLYGEPVMNQTETNMLLQVYGEEVPIGYGADLAEAYCYLKARGVLNVELNMLANISLADALNICMCIADVNSRTDYKEVQLTYELNRDLVSKGYFKRDVTMENPNVKTNVMCDYSNAQFYDYFLRVDEFFPGFKTSGGIDVYNVFVSSEVEDNEGQYPGAYTKSKYVDSQGYTYYHFIVPINYPHNVVTINTVDGTDEPEWINLPRGGGVYYLQNKTSSNVNWTSTASRKTFDEMGHAEWDAFIDNTRSGIEQVKAIEDYTVIDHMFALFKPLTALAAPLFYDNGVQWKFASTANANCYSYEFQITPNEGESYTSEDIEAVKNEVQSVIDYINTDSQFRKDYNLNPNTVSMQVIDEGAGAVSFKITQNIRNAGNPILTADCNIWNLAYDTVRNNISNGNINNTQNDSVSSIADNTFSVSAICNYQGTNALVSYNDLKAKGLFTSYEITDDGVLVLYSRANRVVKLNQKENTIMVGTSLYKLATDTPLFDAASVKGDLLIDFRAAYGWSSYKGVVFKQGQNQNVTVSVASKPESTRIRLYSFPYIQGKEAQYGHLAMCLNASSSSYSASNEKFILSSDMPNSNWIMLNTYNNDRGVTESYLFVYYLAKIWDVGYNGICSKSTMEEETARAKATQESILGYSVNNDGKWFIRQFNISNAADTNTPGTIGFNSTSGFYYTMPTADQYNHTKYLNGELMLPLYCCKSGNLGSSTVINTNINIVNDTYGSVYNYKSTRVVGGNVYKRWEYKLDRICNSNPSGVVDEKGTTQAPTITWNMNIKADDLAPSAVYAYFGGFPKEYITTSKINSYSNAYYFLGARSVDVGKTLSKLPNVPIIMLDTTMNLKKDDATKFYRVATDGSKDVYVFMGNTLEVNMDATGTEDEILEVMDADSLLQFEDWEVFNLNYLLHKVDEGTTWTIVFAFQVLPIFGITCVTALLALSFVSQTKIVQLFSSKVIDLVRILTLGVYNMNEWTFRKGFVFMMVAYVAFALLFNANILTIIQWCMVHMQEIIDIIKLN